MARYLPFLTTIVLVVLLLVVSASAHGGAHDGDNELTDGDSISASEEPNLRDRSLILAKIWCLILVFVGTFAGGISPYFFKWNEGFLVLGTQFAGGVFLGTALMHFLSDSHETFQDLTSKEYPFAFMLASVGYLLTMQQPLPNNSTLTILNSARSNFCCICSRLLAILLFCDHFDHSLIQRLNPTAKSVRFELPYGVLVVVDGYAAMLTNSFCSF